MTISVEWINKEIFYNIPIVENIIAVRHQHLLEKLFKSYCLIGLKVMLIASCNHLIPEQGGHPQYHNKDTLVSNLYL